jgi:hypothetical protein
MVSMYYFFYGRDVHIQQPKYKDDIGSHHILLRHLPAQREE